MAGVARMRAQTVTFRDDYTPGTIVIRTANAGSTTSWAAARAIRYPVGVGRAGKAWFGTRYIDGKRSQSGLVAAAPKCGATSRVCRT